MPTNEFVYDVNSGTFPVRSFSAVGLIPPYDTALPRTYTFEVDFSFTFDIDGHRRFIEEMHYLKSVKGRPDGTFKDPRSISLVGWKWVTVSVIPLDDGGPDERSHAVMLSVSPMVELKPRNLIRSFVLGTTITLNPKDKENYCTMLKLGMRKAIKENMIEPYYNPSEAMLLRYRVARKLNWPIRALTRLLQDDNLDNSRHLQFPMFKDRNAWSIQWSQNS